MDKNKIRFEIESNEKEFTNSRFYRLTNCLLKKCI